MKRALVTGGAGFIGRQVLPLLIERGFEVHALTRGPSQTEPGILWHDGDLLRAGEAERLLALIEPSHLLHLAWYAEPGRFWESPANDEWARASETLFSAAAAVGVERILGVGTCAEYEWDSAPCSEYSTPLRPVTRYGRCKRDVFQSLMEIAPRAGVGAAWARLFHMYGPHEHPERLVPTVIRTLRRQETFICHSGDHSRDFLHVNDVAGALVAILDGRVQGAINVGSGTAAPVRTVVDELARLLGSPDLVLFRSGVKQLNDPPILIADVARLSAEIGWQPGIRLEEGLRCTVEWWIRGRLAAGPEAQQRR